MKDKADSKSDYLLKLRENPGLRKLIEKIPEKGMTKKSQKLLPLIVEGYFKKSLKEIREGLKDKHKGLANKVYARLEKIIREEVLRGVAGVSARHPNDYRDNLSFANIILEYCLKRNELKKELIPYLKEKLEENKVDGGFLKRYDKGR